MRNFLNTFRMSDHWLLQKGVTSDPKKGETLWQSRKALQCQTKQLSFNRIPPTASANGQGGEPCGLRKEKTTAIA